MKARILPGAILPILLITCSRLSAPLLDSPKWADPDTPQPRWFQLQDGALREITPGVLKATALQPWTVQERPAGFAEMNGQLYVAINGRGVARINLGEQPSFDYHYDVGLFQGRTFGGFVARADHLLCHFYFNSLLSPSPGGESPGVGVNLIKLYPGEAGHQISYISPPLQQVEEGWEIVVFHSVTAHRYALEWKRTSSEGTEFHHSLFDLQTQDESSLTRQEFRDSFRVVRLRGGVSQAAGPALNVLINQIVSDLPPDTYISFRLNEQDRVENYLRLPDGSSTGLALEVPMIVQRSRYYALLPDGRLYTVPQGGGATTRLSLPRLPSGFQYTDISVSDGWLIAAWEEIDFYRVGAAGLLVTLGPT